VEFQFVKPGKGAAFTRTKFKNMFTGQVVERNIRSGEKLEPANVETREMQYLYKEADSLVFMDNSNYEQVAIPAENIGDDVGFLKDNTTVTVLFFNERAISVELPTFLELKIQSTEPGFKGDTSGNTLKPAILETGAQIGVPLFINEGDLVKVDTRSYAYVERVRA
jgi:elongation factor P